MKKKVQTVDKTCCDLSIYCSNVTNYHKYVAIKQGVSWTNDINEYGYTDTRQACSFNYTVSAVFSFSRDSLAMSRRCKVSFWASCCEKWLPKWSSKSQQVQSMDINRNCLISPMIMFNAPYIDYVQASTVIKTSSIVLFLLGFWTLKSSQIRMFHFTNSGNILIWTWPDTTAAWLNWYNNTPHDMSASNIKETYSVSHLFAGFAW